MIFVFQIPFPFHLRAVQVETCVTFSFFFFLKFFKLFFLVDCQEYTLFEIEYRCSMNVASGVLNYVFTCVS